ncbi:hypothetical protein [Clostridium butyricum]|uniref:hypothetical protein n=1 Tax=Clostridium butyricum TaxID=1492 RepID=UPI00325AE651
MYDYIVNFSVVKDNSVDNREEVVTLDDWYDIDFRETFILDELKNWYDDNEYDEIIVTGVKDLIDSSVNVENIADTYL